MTTGRDALIEAARLETARIYSGVRRAHHQQAPRAHIEHNTVDLHIADELAARRAQRNAAHNARRRAARAAAARARKAGQA